MQNDYSDPRWQRLRLKCMDRDNWKCVACGDAQSTLHVHHKRYCGSIWDSPLEDLQTLCNSCHVAIGQHPKAGVWYQRIGDIKEGECRNKTWSSDDDVTDDTVVLAIQNCAICGSNEFISVNQQLMCSSCSWSMEIRPHLFIHSPAILINAEQQKKIEEQKEAAAKRKAAIGQLRSCAARCRKHGFSDADIWAASFPEHAVPLGYQFDAGGLLAVSDIADQDAQKLRAYLTSGMTFSDVVWEVAGVSDKSREALAQSGY